MPKSKSPRKKYRPPATPITIERLQPVRYKRRDEVWLKTAPHVALDEIREGRGTTDHFNSVCIRVHWGQRMLADHFTPGDVAEHAGTIQSAIEAVTSISDRYDSTGTIFATATEFERIGVALCLTDELQTATTKIEQERSLRAVLQLSEQDLRRLAGL